MAASQALDPLFLSFQTALAGRYSLERELGRGGMGVVYLAREVRLDRPVAIKLLPPSRARDAALRERFMREARTAAKLSHPNVIPIFTVDEVGEFVFFAMAYVEGETLTERVRSRGPLPPSEAARMLREAAWALAYAHSQGLVHRDVKPDNIILESGTGRALVADFGIAGAVRDAGGLAGEVIGTPEFMSPEQALGEQVDGRSDLYALGCVGFFALSGKLPFEAEKATEVLAKQVTEPAPPLATAAPVPRKLAAAIDRCLAKDPAERPQKAEDFAERLTLALEQRKEIPVALRAFVKHNARLDGGGVLLYPFGLLFASGFVGSLFGTESAFMTLIGGLTVVPTGVLVNRARRLLMSGFDHPDLGVAFRTELEQGREERAVEHGHGPSLLERVFKAITAVGLGSVLIGLVIADATEVGAFMGFLGLFAAMGGGLGVLVLLQRRRDVDTEFWGKLWMGRLGRWLFGIARALTPRRALTTPMTHRPTELSLGMAAAHLYEQLPRETRQQLRDLPDVVHRLEVDAGKMRARLNELRDALGGIGDEGKGTGQAGELIETRRSRITDDLRKERDLVQQRLADAVAALETIRLNLLRLHAGTGSVRRVTTDLGLAKEVAREVDRLLQAKREIDDLLA
jgi:serine/threonine-protein kinase